ncbi:CDGSH iron-sulfur domain-containing protein [Jiangella alba]|uniref:CDGSH iron-sulfur domain-containing protein n=1 Tax=Jiangella alba TaxID=561176 RepID=UPI00318341C7
MPRRAAAAARRARRRRRRRPAAPHHPPRQPVCRCGRSAGQPWCDGTHKVLPDKLKP